MSEAVVDAKVEQVEADLPHKDPANANLSSKKDENEHQKHLDDKTQTQNESKEQEHSAQTDEANVTEKTGSQSVKNGTSVKANERTNPQEKESEVRNSSQVEQGRRWNNRDRDRQAKGGHSQNKFRKNNKFDPTFQEKTSDPFEIRKQVEFYFSDSNLMTDKFLFAKVDGHKNLPVPIEIIHSFKRMRRFEPRAAVVEALKNSKVLNVVDDDSAIQRKEPLPEGLVGKPIDELQKVHETSSMARSVYVKGFGDEESKTQFDIEAFFANYGPTNSVRLRRHNDGTFKGSAFVEFDNEETQKSFLSLDPKPQWHGNPLQIKSKKEYCDNKVEDIQAGRIRPKSPRLNQSDADRKKSGHGKGRQDRRKGEDDRDWRQRRDEDRADGFRDRDRNRKPRGSERGREDRHDTKGESKTQDRRVSPTSPADETHPPNPQVSAPPAQSEGVAGTDENTTTKKRSREDDQDTETQGKEKKVDTKED